MLGRFYFSHDPDRVGIRNVGGNNLDYITYMAGTYRNVGGKESDWDLEKIIIGVEGNNVFVMSKELWRDLK